MEHKRTSSTAGEKGAKPTFTFGAKPVPMKLFATWEVDRTPPNCVPRICSVNISRLEVLKPLATDLNHIIIAVKMQSSKRILRSHEVAVNPSGLIDTELQLTFTLQYPHFLKREGNRLHVMIQRRKRYKNRTILGFKTLAIGTINMSKVLQREMDLELELHTDIKEKHNLLARVTMQSLTSQPVDHEDSMHSRKDLGENPEFSDEDEDYSSPEEGGSDSETIIDDGLAHRQRSRKSPRPKLHNMQQRNIKQKIFSLLKRFKMTDDLHIDDPDDEIMEQKLTGGDDDLQALFDELDEISGDSGPEMDRLSISSTPKPSLRPFFSSSKSLIPENSQISERTADSDSHAEGGWTDAECSDAPLQASSSGEERGTKRSCNISEPSVLPSHYIEEIAWKGEKQLPKTAHSLPRRGLMEQLGSLFPPEYGDSSIPDAVILVHGSEPLGATLASILHDRLGSRVIITHSMSDVRIILSSVVSRIQKFCTQNVKVPTPIRIGVAGSDPYMSHALRPYVEQMASKPPDWVNYIRFFFIPIGSSAIAHFLGSSCTQYQTMFVDASWRELLEGGETAAHEVSNRVTQYLYNAPHSLPIPVAEAMITYREKGSEEESSQIFVPFINEVHVSMAESGGANSTSLEMDDTPSNIPSGSPTTNTSHHLEVMKAKENITPPNSPGPVTTPHPPLSARSESGLLHESPLELQVEYWMGVSRQKSLEKDKDKDNKCSLKAMFRSLQVNRLPPPSLTLTYSLKEKKQKIMRLGKKKEKDREVENKAQVAEGIQRLVCLAKSPYSPLKVYIDGLEWTGVKFFQLSAQWQTQVKHLSLGIFSNPDSNLS